MTHYWDANGELVAGFAPVLGLKDGKAWDVYLLYDQNAEWKDSFPKPNFWQEQLGISQETTLDAEKLTDAVKKMLLSKTD